MSKRTFEKKQWILTLIAFGAVITFFVFPQQASIYNFEAPIFSVGDTTFTRGDIYYTLDILSIIAFTVAFFMAIKQYKRKKKND